MGWKHSLLTDSGHRKRRYYDRFPQVEITEMVVLLMGGWSHSSCFCPQTARFHYDADERWCVEGAAQGAFDLERLHCMKLGIFLGRDTARLRGLSCSLLFLPGVTKGLHGDDIQGIGALYNTCIVILISLCVCLLIRFIFRLLFSSKTRNTRKLPPGPPTLHLIANFLWHRKPFFEHGKIVSDLRKRYDPIITIKIGSEPTIFITNNTLAYQALVLNGAIFADRPKTTFADRIFPNKRKGVSLFPYGATWRSFRRNLTGTSGVLHPSRLISCFHIRKCVLDNLIHRLKQDSEHGGGIHVVDHFTAREKMKQGEDKGENIDQFVSYVDTLLELQVPDENKKFEEGDIVALSDEFIDLWELIQRQRHCNGSWQMWIKASPADLPGGDTAAVVKIPNWVATLYPKVQR
ncbi:hypothetical protein Patl1_21994 [Pistacia atlantica]|uniref:Uncharacterized protein n=1 Tax=Pistacia atlantica TaxID=434234 RepID=A0ACC1BMG3_9ROSI|nr:hypothetical protein Patl1_21994 [Pistacia atlantica]